MKRKDLVGTILALPGILGFLLFYIIPFGVSMYYSIINNTLERRFVGLTNYISVINNTYYRLALSNTLTFTLISVPIAMILAFIIANLLINIKSGKRFFRAAFILPIFVPSVALITFWNVFFGENSQITNFMLRISLEKNLLNIQFLVKLVPVYLFYIWKNIGLYILVYIAGIMKIPKEYIEAAQIDGASSLNCFRFITLPLLIPVVFFVLIMSIVQSFKIFKEVYLLHGAYPSDELYFVQHFINNKFLKLHYAELSAGTIIFILIISMIVLLVFTFWKIAVKHYDN